VRENSRLVGQLAMSQAVSRSSGHGKLGKTRQGSGDPTGLGTQVMSSWKSIEMVVNEENQGNRLRVTLSETDKSPYSVKKWTSPTTAK
jgi:hypothetical protein